MIWMVHCILEYKNTVPGCFQLVLTFACAIIVPYWSNNNCTAIGYFITIVVAANCYPAILVVAYNVIDKYFCAVFC